MSLPWLIQALTKNNLQTNVKHLILADRANDETNDKANVTAATALLFTQPSLIPWSSLLIHFWAESELTPRLTPRQDLCSPKLTSHLLLCSQPMSDFLQTHTHAGENTDSGVQGSSSKYREMGRQPADYNSKLARSEIVLCPKKSGPAWEGEAKPRGASKKLHQHPVEKIDDKWQRGKQKRLNSMLQGKAKHGLWTQNLQGKKLAALKTSEI